MLWLKPYVPVTGPIAIHPIVVGPLMRKTVSMCLAAPGVGKSTWAQLATIAIRHERPDILGESPLTPLWPGHVVILAGEDSERIVNAKLTAMETYNGLTTPPKHGVSIIPMAGRKLFQLDATGKVEFVGDDLLDDLGALRAQHDIALIVIDTLSACLQGLNENSAEHMQAVMDLLTELADAAFCSILLVHHTSKGSMTENGSSVYAARGSSVLTASARSIFKLSRPSKEQILTANWTPDQAKLWVSLEVIKASYTDPTTYGDRWFRFIPLVVPAYDPRDQSQHTMSIGILESRGFPVGSLTSLFGTKRQLWDKLKDALRSGEVFHKKRAFNGKSITKDVLGDRADELIDEWILGGLITVTGRREGRVVWDGVADMAPERPVEDEDEV